MLLLIEKIIILKSIKIFSEIGEDDLLNLANSITEVEYTAGTTIINQGDVGTSMYVIVSGNVDVVVNENKVATLGEREVFGELAALDPEPRAATIISSEDTLLFKIESATLYNLMAEYPNVAHGIISILCQRIRNS